MTMKILKHNDDFIKTRKYVDVKKFPDYLLRKKFLKM